MTLEERYGQVRAATDELARPLAAEDQVVQSMDDVSPTKWHRAHTSWFFETFLLKPCLAGYRPLDQAYEFLFNSYYEAFGARHGRTERGLLSRPTVDEITKYRGHVDQGMAGLFGGAGDNRRREIEPLVELGLHHEEQHQELLLTDIKHVFSRNPLAPAYRDDLATAPGGAPGLAWYSFEGGIVEIGHDGSGFAFDNEGPRHKVLLRPYRLASRPATNAEFRAFIEDGGYQRHEHWLSDGWAVVRAENWQMPIYWRREDGAWTEFTLGGMLPLDPGAPVCHLSFFEAEAFARWSGKRLPTEAEWENAAVDAAANSAHGQEHQANFAGRGILHPAATVAANGGLAQMFGDVWEWTASAYAPYPGFRPAPEAIGEYNGKFMSGQMVLKGGSCATAPGHVRASYRNFFYPPDRWQFSGVRLAEDA